jgi:hypothetical protein
MKKAVEFIILGALLTAIALLMWKNVGLTKINNALLGMEPDTVTYYDTILPVDSINWIDSVSINHVTIFDTIYGDTVNFYNDSVVNDELAIYFRDRVDGIVLDRQIGYKLKVPKIIESTTVITKPYPVEQATRTKVFYGFGAGWSREGLAGSAGIDILTKKNRLYGIQYLRTQSSGYFLLNVKFKI